MVGPDEAGRQEEDTEVGSIVPAIPSDVLLSVACLLSVLLSLFALAVALQTILVRKLDLGFPVTIAERPVSATKPQSAPQVSPRQPLLVTGPDVPIAFPLYRKNVYQNGSRVFCIFNDGVVRRTRRNISFCIDTFPYHLCTDAVFCCCVVGYRNLALCPNSSSRNHLRFHGLKLRNPSLRTWITAGGSPVSSAAFSRIAVDSEARRHFVRQAVNWLRDFGYEGLVVHWTFPDSEQRDGLESLVRSLKTAFDLTGQLLAIAVPLEENKRRGFDTRSVADLLGGHTVLLTPTLPLELPYNQTFFPHTDDDLDRYAKVAREMNSTAHHPCYLVSIRGTSFVLTNRSRWEIGDSAQRLWTANTSGTPGVVATDDVCKQHWIGSKRTRYGVYSRRGYQWAGYLTKDTLADFLSSLANATGTKNCLGVVDPEWDDFSGACDARSPYPLMRTVFAAVTGVGRAPRLPEEEEA